MNLSRQIERKMADTEKSDGMQNEEIGNGRRQEEGDDDDEEEEEEEELEEKAIEG